MKILISAIGKSNKGPEAELTQDYLNRFDKIGRNLGLGPAELITSEAKNSDQTAEAALLEKPIPAGARLLTLDERGKLLDSISFANKLAEWRDTDNRPLAILIGGADGIDPTVRANADFSMSFGKMVWPHMLARVMLAEQLYRAASILSGSPYHRV